MKPLRLPPLFPARAEALAAACERNDHESELRALAQDLRKLLKPREKKLPRLQTFRRRLVRHLEGVVRWTTKKLRLAVWTRSEGFCENADCGARITWSEFDLDHYLGRARAPQQPENTWALCQTCHDRKHAGAPSRVYWHRTFLRHLDQHGFGRSETGSKVRAQLEGEELIAKAAEISARAVSGAEDLAGRARRAEGAADAGQ